MGMEERTASVNGKIIVDGTSGFSAQLVYGTKRSVSMINVKHVLGLFLKVKHPPPEIE